MSDLGKIDSSDSADRKPAAKETTTRGSELMDAKPSAKQPAQESPDASDQKQPPPKKKRKSPAVPWKKPKDMPKRPLSAYNLFFKEERSRLLKTVPKRKKASPSTSQPQISIGEGASDATSKGKHGTSSGLGFASLAKTIAAKWKELDPARRAPFEKRAATDKKRYDAAVSVWREKQKAQKDAEKKEHAAEERQRQRNRIAALTQSSMMHSMQQEQPLSNLSDHYPSEWFETASRSPTSPRNLSSVQWMGAGGAAGLHMPFANEDQHQAPASSHFHHVPPTPYQAAAYPPLYGPSAELSPLTFETAPRANQPDMRSRGLAALPLLPDVWSDASSTFLQQRVPHMHGYPSIGLPPAPSLATAPQPYGAHIGHRDVGYQRGPAEEQPDPGNAPRGGPSIVHGEDDEAAHGSTMSNSLNLLSNTLDDDDLTFLANLRNMR